MVVGMVEACGSVLKDGSQTTYREDNIQGICDRFRMEPVTHNMEGICDRFRQLLVTLRSRGFVTAFAR